MGMIRNAESFQRLTEDMADNMRQASRLFDDLYVFLEALIKDNNTEKFSRDLAGLLKRLEQI